MDFPGRWPSGSESESKLIESHERLGSTQEFQRRCSFGTLWRLLLCQTFQLTEVADDLSNPNSIEWIICGLVGGAFPWAKSMSWLRSSHLFVACLDSCHQVIPCLIYYNLLILLQEVRPMNRMMQGSKLTVRLTHYPFGSFGHPCGWSRHVTTRHFFEKTRATLRRPTVAIQPSRCLVVLDVTNSVGCSVFSGFGVFG